MSAYGSFLNRICKIFFISVLGMLIISGCRQRSSPPAEKIFVNGHIITMDENISEVEALAIDQGKTLTGMLADFIVLSDDILTIPVQKLLSLQVEQTYLDGILVYDK